MLKAKRGFQSSLNGLEGVNHLQVISLCFISDVQGPVNSCPDKPLSAVPSLQAVCMPLKDGESVDSFKVKPFEQKKMHECYKKKGTSRVGYTFVNMSSCAGVKEMLLCLCVFCASARVCRCVCACVCYLYFVMLNLFILLGRHFLRW